ncbi:MAG TPA: type II secretion system protein [Patescibacteria group bacterium]|nr:type II secretion system protein [Patescibacteria group bacterium]
MMGTNARRGFTLIEVILFLAISGLMLLGVLAGVSGSISRQRYDEATNSLLDYVKSQYNLNDNIRNNRPDTRACTAAGIAANTAQPRGTSDCAIAGRLISSTDGKSISSRPVYARSAGNLNAATEATLLNSLNLIVAPSDLKTDNEDYTMLWQTQIYTNKNAQTTANHFGILILRLPTNGLTRTYVSTSYTTLADFWTAAPALTELNLCVSKSGLTNAPANGTKVIRGASTSNGVQFIPGGAGTC